MPDEGDLTCLLQETWTRKCTKKAMIQSPFAWKVRSVIPLPSHCPRQATISWEAVVVPPARPSSSNHPNCGCDIETEPILLYTNIRPQPDRCVLPRHYNASNGVFYYQYNSVDLWKLAWDRLHLEDYGTRIQESFTEFDEVP